MDPAISVSPKNYALSALFDFTQKNWFETGIATCVGRSIE